MEAVQANAQAVTEATAPVDAGEVQVVAVSDEEAMAVEELAAVLGQAPADVPFDDDILTEPPGVLPTAVADTAAEPLTNEVAAIVAQMGAPAAGASEAGSGSGEITGGEATDGRRNKIDAVEAANGVREILQRMNNEKRQQEAAARSPS